jgi:hypothetical protein
MDPPRLNSPTDDPSPKSNLNFKPPSMVWAVAVALGILLLALLPGATQKPVSKVHLNAEQLQFSVANILHF